MRRILFVCTGNTCRSPLAEHLLKAMAEDRYEVKSAGIAAFDGDQASQQVHHVLEEKGIVIQHQAQSVTPELIDWADLVLTMTKQHEQILQARFPEQEGKIVALKAYVTDEETNLDVTDPFGGSVEVYRKTRDELEELLKKFLEKEENQSKQEK